MYMSMPASSACGHEALVQPSTWPCAFQSETTKPPKSMASFADVLTPEDAAAIHAYLIARGNEDYADASARGN